LQHVVLTRLQQVRWDGLKTQVLHALFGVPSLQVLLSACGTPCAGFSVQDRVGWDRRRRSTV
jgi:hypothetical protein